MTEAISLLVGILVGAWLMHRKQERRSPLPFQVFGENIEVQDIEEQPLNEGNRL